MKKTTSAYNLETSPLTLASTEVNSAEGELENIISQIEHDMRTYPDASSVALRPRPPASPILSSPAKTMRTM